MAERDGALLGWASFGACRESGEDAESEIYAIYVEPVAQRHGLGARLLAASEMQLRARQPTATRVSLWVLERNTAARRFYERSGYAAGPRTKTEVIGGESFLELRHEKSLRPTV